MDSSSDKRGKLTEEEEKQIRLNGILIRLTRQNISKSIIQVKEVKIDTVITLSGLVFQIYEMSLKPQICEMYADFCSHLASNLPKVNSDGRMISFKHLLLNKCQEEFERGERDEIDNSDEPNQSKKASEEIRLEARRRMLGNIRLIGELYKKRMLTERIMHECIKKLLGDYQNPEEENVNYLNPNEKNIEALFKLLSTIGKMIDHVKAKEKMDAHFRIMTELSMNMKLSSTVRSMLKDVIDLRRNGWEWRRKVVGPEKIDKICRPSGPRIERPGGAVLNLGERWGKSPGVFPPTLGGEIGLDPGQQSHSAVSVASTSTTNQRKHHSCSELQEKATGLPKYHAIQGDWKNDRGAGILPKHMNFRDERFVSELRLNKTLSRKVIQFQEPSELACYSCVEGGDLWFDDRCLRLFKYPAPKDIGTNLNDGFDTFTEKKDLGSEDFCNLLACIRATTRIALDNIHFVTFRNNLNKIMATAYIRHEPWEMGVHKRNGVVYLDVHKLPERSQSETDRRMCYWGYCFESLATESPRRAEEGEEGIHHIDANVEYCAVIETKLGDHKILMGAEMDCYDFDDMGRRIYLELKTSRELQHHTEDRFERVKLLKIWIQSFLAGVPYIVVGFRDDQGRLVRVERIRTRDITHRVKTKNYWQGSVCLAFADEVLCWLYGTVKENEDYRLRFAQPFQRLELLHAQSSCPDVITYHLKELQRGGKE